MVLGILIEISSGNLLFAGVPESLTLLAFGVGLIGATAGLRRIFKRQDGTKSDHNHGENTKE